MCSTSIHLTTDGQTDNISPRSELNLSKKYNLSSKSSILNKLNLSSELSNWWGKRVCLWQSHVGQ